MKVFYLTPQRTPEGTYPQFIEPVEIPDPDRLPIEALRPADVWVLDLTHPAWATSVLRNLRTFTDPEVYLRPLFGFPKDADFPDFWATLLDGSTDLGALPALTAQAEKIMDRIRRLEPLQEEHFEIQVLIRLLRYLYTRDQRLQPIRDPSRSTGYTYPFLVLHFQPTDEHRIFDIVDLGEREGLLQGRFVDRFHLCPDCYSAFLNFRETCPACSSADLKREDLVHHFVCAHVAPESDFLQGDELICPKCHRQLRHIGVDYDRPSVLYTCRTCGHEFQNPMVRARCFQCGAQHLVENLIEKVAKEYDITSKGRNAALSGFTLTLGSLFHIEGVVDYATFKTFLRHEIERVRRSQRPSTLAYFEFTNFEELYLSIGDRRTRVFEEIARVIRENIRGSDVLSYLNERTLLFLYPETPVEGAQVALQRITQFIHQLVRDNFQNFQPLLKTNAIPIDPQGTVESHLEQLFKT